MSAYTISAGRRPISASLGRRAGVIGLVLAVLTLMTTAAWAYWSTTGNGTGSAVTGTLNSPTTVAASSTAGSGQVNVSWEAPTGGSTPTGYYVERSDSTDVTEPACGTSPGSLITDLNCDDNLVPDGEYTYVVTAVMNSWTAASAPSGSVVVTNTLGTTTDLVSSANPSVVGQTVTYTATVSATSGTPSGVVTFKDDGYGITCANPGGQTLSTGQATCQVTYGAVGTHQVTAEYSGATGFDASTSNAVAQVVNKAATSTALVSSANPSKSGQQVTYTATVSVTSPGSATPTGTVDFTDGSTTICASRPVSGGSATCTATYPGVSSHAVAATYAGDANLLSSTSSQLNQSVAQATTSTTLTSGTNPAVTGQTVTFTATVAVTGPGAGTPAGSVTFKNGGADIVCGPASQAFNGSTATCVTTFPSTGSRSITADFSGGTDFSGSTSSAVTQAVNKANTSTTLSASPSPSTTGQSVTLTATVSAASPGAGVPGGTVAFKDGTTTITSCAAQPVNGSGVATCTTSFGSAGARTLNAEYSGDADYNASVGSTSHTVNTPVATTTTLASSAMPAKTGQTVTYTATVSATSGTPSGTVTFKDGTATIACTGGNQTLSGSPTRTATCQTSFSSTGDRTITATYNGQGVHSSSASAPLAQRVVNPAVTGIVLNNLTVSSGTVSCSGTGTANYSCTVTGALSNASLSAGVTFVNASGAQTVYSTDATQIGWSRARPNPATGSIEVAGGAAASSTTVSSSKQGNQDATLTFTVDGLTATVTME
jgi:hypothetical protein